MKKLSILLLAVYTDGMRNNLEEIGLGCLAGYLREKGYDVTLRSLNAFSPDHSLLADSRPDIVGFSLYTINKNSVYDFSRALKRMLPDVIICAGGSLPSYNGSRVLQECEAIDIVVRGEGEITFWELVERIACGARWDDIRGLTYRSGDRIVENENRPLIESIEALPQPARDLMVQNGAKIALISTSRGCNAKCSFCASQLFWKQWRGRSPQKVVDEIETIARQYGVRTFMIIDGSFEDPGPGLDRMLAIAREINGRGLRICYYANIRADFYRKASEEAMTLLKESGLCSACIGIESGNEADLKLYHKIASPAEIKLAVDLFRKYEINVEPGFINFNPYTTFDKLRQNIQFLEEYGFASNIMYVMTCAKLYQGTRLYERAASDRLISDEGKFGYQFLDNRVQRLLEFIQDYLLTDIKTRSACRAIDYYTTLRLTAIACYKRFFEGPEHQGAYQILKEYEQNHLVLFGKANRKVSQWFNQLISIAEAGWDETLARNASDQLLSQNDIVEMAFQFDRLKNIYNRNLLRHNMKYEVFLLDYLAGN